MNALRTLTLVSEGDRTHVRRERGKPEKDFGESGVHSRQSEADPGESRHDQEKSDGDSEESGHAEYDRCESEEDFGEAGIRRDSCFCDSCSLWMKIDLYWR